MAHRSNIDEAIGNQDLPAITQAFKKWDSEDNDISYVPAEEDPSQKFGIVPDAFRIPICRSPHGEAISAVWQSHGRNCKHYWR